MASTVLKCVQHFRGAPKLRKRPMRLSSSLIPQVTDFFSKNSSRKSASLYSPIQNEMSTGLYTYQIRFFRACPKSFCWLRVSCQRRLAPSFFGFFLVLRRGSFNKNLAAIKRNILSIMNLDIRLRFWMPAFAGTTAIFIRKHSAYHII